MLLELMHYYYTIIIRIHTGIHFYYSVPIILGTTEVNITKRWTVNGTSVWEVP